MTPYAPAFQSWTHPFPLGNEPWTSTIPPLSVPWRLNYQSGTWYWYDNRSLDRIF